MQLLITGSSGFIGKNVLEQAAQRQCRTRPFDRTDDCDVLDFDQLCRASCDCDAIIHCAGWVGTHHSFDHVRDVIATNITGTLNVLQAATDLDLPVVVVSLKNDWLNPYMITKQASARFVRMYHEYHGTKTVLLRAMNVYGPHQGTDKQKIVPDFVMNALSGTPLMIYGDGSQIIDMTHVDDLVEVIFRALEKKVWGTEIEVGSGVPSTVLEVAREIENIVRSPLELRFVPMRKGEPSSSVSFADCTTMKRVLDYCPAVPWRDGLRRTVQWYAETLGSSRNGRHVAHN